MEDLSGSVAVVTGGGPNLGRTVSSTLARAGARVVVFDIDTDAADETVAQISDAGGEAVAVECDASDSESVTSRVAEVASEFGRIDIVVNNAGGATGYTIEDIDRETFDANIDANLRSAFFTTKAALPFLRADAGGSVVYVSSVNALFGGFGEVAYATAKGGLHALARCLTADYTDSGVRFNVVAPGSIVDDSATWNRRESEDPGTLDRLRQLYPRGRVGRPSDVAELVTFLASDRADWISGVVIPVDGGLTATGALPGGEWWKSI